MPNPTNDVTPQMREISLDNIDYSDMGTST